MVRVIKVLSFDLDGTLADLNFEDVIWNREVPLLYSEQYGISLAEAKKIIKTETDAVGDKRLEWYSISYWFKHFKLKAEPERMMEDASRVIKLYPETTEVLSALKPHYKLVVVSNATREFLKFKMRVDGLESYFSKVISLPSDFQQLKSHGYDRVLKELRVSADQIVHVGDHYDFDYLMPKQSGIRSYYLDRRKKMCGPHVVHSLTEFASRIRELD